MKTKYLLLVGMVVVLAGCSTAYKNGQTPDDVYYSPAPAAESYVVKNNRNDRNSYSYRNAEEREIRQAIRNPRYRSTISLGIGTGGYFPYANNSFGYNPYANNSFGYNPYGYNPFGYDPFGYNYYGYGKGYYDPFGYNPYYSYNPYYPSYGFNPGYGNYYPPVNYYPVPGKASNNRGARMYNLGSYTPSPSTTPRGITPTRSGIFRPAPTAPVRSFNNRTTTPVRKEKSGLGSGIRRVFTPSNKRTYTPPANKRRVERSNTPPVRRFDPPVRRMQPPVRSTNTPPVRRTNTPPVRSNNTPPVRSTNNPPVRTFDPSPAISTPAPAASSSSTPAKQSSSTPVRTFRNN